MDIKEFAADFMDTVLESASNEGRDFDEELTESILDYVIDSGDACAPTVCFFKKTMARLNAYDYNDEGESLDLFILVRTNSLLGKISRNEIDKAFSRLYGFFEQVAKGKLRDEVESPFDGFNEISELVNEALKTNTMLRLFVLTNGLAEYNPSTVETDFGMVMEQNVWDMQRIYQQDCIKRGKEKVEIDFPAVYGTKLQCLKVDGGGGDVESYLAVIPANTLSRIYKKYRHTLLEKNVRTFLQFKPKVNRNIKNTLLKEPEMFFAYNNGISSTASEIETIKEGASLYITKLYNWQIVNGGQTTGTIAAVGNEAADSLVNVSVPMKISVIRNKDRAGELIGNISKNANSQTAIKNSDFSANDPFLVELETFSRTEWVPNKMAKPENKWYFERTRGQYLDEMSQLSGITLKMFKNEYPKGMKLTKADIAIFEECWNGKPNIVCKGGEESYKQFVKDIRQNETKCSLYYYRHLIAKAILFRTIDGISKAQQVVGFKSCVNAYTLFCVSKLSNKNLDLDYIWENQSVQQNLRLAISDSILPMVRNVFGSVSSSPRQYARSTECLETITEKLQYIEPLPQSLIKENGEIENEISKQAQREKIAEASRIGSSVWFGLAKWATRGNVFTPTDRRKLFNYGVKKQKGRPMDFKQACSGIDLMNRAVALGFKYQEDTVYE